MSVRQERRRDPATGKWLKFWRIDVCLRLPSGELKRVKKTSPIPTRRGAEALERQIRIALLDGTYGREHLRQVPTFREFAEEYVEVQAKPNDKPSSLSGKRGVIKNHLNPFFGATRLNQINKRQIAAYKAKKLKADHRLGAGGYSKKTINNHLGILSGILSTAVEWEVIPQAPKVGFFKTDPGHFDFLDFEEFRRLVDAAEEGVWQTMISFAGNTGLRLGELMALRWEDCDLVKGQIVVRRNRWKNRFVTPKSNRFRTIPLNPPTLLALKRHKHLRGELVFCQEDGTVLTEQICRRALMRATKFAGLRHIGWHALRHTFASHLVMRGVSLKAVQELLGHQGMEMTLRYSHLSPDVRRDAVNALVTDVQLYGQIAANNSVEKNRLS